MEVHAHTHTARKKWTHYFWEFLMLFLAVTLGFFVENFREHQVEHKRAKGLVISLITDLQKDTSLINSLEDFRFNKRKLRLDSFHRLLNMPPEKVDKSIFYPLIYNIAEFNRFNQSNGTLNQLKNAGYLRYFNDSKLLNYISEYEYDIQSLKGDETLEYHLHYDQFMQLVKQNSDDEGLRKVYFENSSPKGLGITPIEPKTLKSMNILLTELSWYNYPQMKTLLDEVKSKAVEIMQYLHTKYKIN